MPGICLLAPLHPRDEHGLVGWIVEAAIGLNASEATVMASAGESGFLDRDLMREAEQRVQALTGRSIKLEIDPDDPPIPQGVVLKAKNGRVEFNNQVATRLLRSQSEIRKSIQDRLWKNESSDR